MNPARHPKALLLLVPVVLCLTLVGTAFSVEERGIRSVPSGGGPLDWGTYHAFLIGINQYAQWPELRTAVNDVVALRRVLIERYGFDPARMHVRTDGEATRSAILKDLRALVSGLGGRDNLLVYFAGHGQLDEVLGGGYWIPVDGALKEASTWIANDTIRRMLSSEAVRAKNIAVVADSCYSGSLLRGGPSLLSLENEGYRKKLAAMASRRSRQVLTSGGMEPVVDGGRDGHSLFAYYFLRGLEENRRRLVDLENLFVSSVWRPVFEISGQRPHVGRIRTPMDEDGQFVLVSRESEAEARPPSGEEAGDVLEAGARLRSSTKAFLFEDFEDGDALNAWGGAWYAYSDRESLGGSSEVKPSPGEPFSLRSPGARGSDFCGGIRGTVRGDVPHPFVGLGCFLNPQKGPVSLARFSGVAFHVRGDGKAYRLKIHTLATRDFDDLGYAFTAPDDWTRVVVPFEACSQEGWGKPAVWDNGSCPEPGCAAEGVLSLNWQSAGGGASAVELDIDNVIFY